MRFSIRLPDAIAQASESIRNAPGAGSGRAGERLDGLRPPTSASIT